MAPAPRMDMMAHWREIRAAVDFSGMLPGHARVVVQDGQLQVRTRSMLITRATTTANCVVAVADLERAVKVAGLCEVHVTARQVTVEGGGARVVLPRLDTETVQPTPPMECVPVGDLCEAIGDVLPFTAGTSLHPWSTGARIDGDRVTATDSITLIGARLASAVPIAGLTLPRELLTYLLSRRDDVRTIGADDRSVLVTMTDGGSVLGSVLAAGMPDTAVTMVDQYDYSQVASIGDDRDALLEAATFADDYVTIGPQQVHAMHGGAEYTRAWPRRAVGDQARFSREPLKLVARYAESVDFSPYPKPALFTTARGSRGLLCGRT